MGDPQKGEVKDDPWVSRLSSFMGVSTAYSEGENWERRHWDGKNDEFIYNTGFSGLF